MKKAIVVGASSGIGAEVARLLLADGWKVGVAARRIELLRGNFGDDAICEAIDVTEEGAEEKLLGLIERLGGVDLYFHASGVGKQNPSLEAQIEMQTVGTNAMGFSRMVGCAYRYMAEHGGGHIAVISSIAGTMGLGAAPSYSATKAFQNTYIQALEQLSNMRRLNIRFTDIRPGFVDTALLSKSHYPMLMRPEKVARDIVRAVYRKKHVVVIDWRWRVVTAFWVLIPRFVWRQLRISNG